ncbi:MAG: hypothetical protein ACE5J7_03120 [Candidatus Aenigmatarchaeota archaeon]
MAVNKKGHRRERQLVEKLVKEGWVVHRVAGSGLKDSAICDLIAIKHGITHLIEVKSRKKVFYTKEHHPQLKEMISAAKKCGARAMLAVKLDYREWQFIDLHEGIPHKVG